MTTASDKVRLNKGSVFYFASSDTVTQVLFNFFWKTSFSGLNGPLDVVDPLFQSLKLNMNLIWTI